MEQVVRKSNKENTKPVGGPKNQVINSIVSKQKVLIKSVPLQSKNDFKEDNSGKSVKDKDVRPKSKTNDADPAKRSTLSQAFRTQQYVRHRKLVEEVQKPPSTALQKSKPGTYKGRMVHSKIDCFRKPSGDVKTTEKRVISKPDVIRPKAVLPKIRSKSVTALPASSRPRINSALSSRPKSVTDVPLHVIEIPVQRSVSQKQIPSKVPGAISQAGACIPPRPVPLATGRSAISKPFPSKKKETVVHGGKPKAAITTTEQKVRRPIASKVSNYRVQMETAEERRAKLAEWLASKGKALKRPPISEKLATHLRKPDPQPKTGPKATIVSQAEAVKPTPEMKMNIQTEDIEIPDNRAVHSSKSSNIMNTTLDFLDNSDMELPVDPEIRMESLVLNLCEKLDALEMEIPSSCTNEIDRAVVLAGKRMEVQVEEQETDKVYEILEEKEDSDSDVTEDTKEAVVKNEDYEDSEDEISSTPPEIEGASIVKYNVKTTPYLQSVKRKIECDTAPGSGSRRKSTIKDLKFLTPVRRSTRIHRKSSRLPNMLNDHDTCVSSLAELVQLEDADANAYIYRKNPALLEELPDQPGDLAKECS